MTFSPAFSAYSAAAAAWAMTHGGLPVLQSAGPGASAGQVLDALLVYGPLGLCLVLVLLDWLVPKASVARLVQDLESVKRQRDALVEQFGSEVIPALYAVHQQVVPAINRIGDMQTELARLSEEVRRLSQMVDAARSDRG